MGHFFSVLPDGKVKNFTTFVHIIFQKKKSSQFTTYKYYSYFCFVRVME